MRAISARWKKVATSSITPQQESAVSVEMWLRRTPNTCARRQVARAGGYCWVRKRAACVRMHGAMASKDRDRAAEATPAGLRTIALRGTR